MCLHFPKHPAAGTAPDTVLFGIKTTMISDLTLSAAHRCFNVVEIFHCKYSQSVSRLGLRELFPVGSYMLSIQVFRTY